MNPQNFLFSELMKCQTMREIFNYLDNYFDLSAKPIPSLYKLIIVNGILAAIKMLDPKLK
jgi:hypothetical protein